MRSVVFAALLGGVTALGAHLALERWLPEGSMIPGTELLGRVQPAGRPLLGWLDQLQSRLGESTVYLTTPSETRELRAFELGLHLDVTETARRIRAHAERGPITDRLARAWRAQKGRERIEPVWSFDQARALATLTKLQPLLRREAVDARLDLRRHERIQEVYGRELDVEESLKHVETLTPGLLMSVPLVFRTREPNVRLAELSAIDVTRVLGSYTTDFAKKAGPRAINIRTAARRLDKTMLPPGAVFSFNRTVGERTWERGFVEAPVIVNDEMEPGLGGGVCQVASTLHAAVVYGGLEVVERRSHSRPSGYTPLGLDAVVVDGAIDLKFKNTTNITLMIHAYLPTKTTVRVELLGAEPPGKIVHSIATLERHDFVRRVTTRDELTAPEPIRRQRGQYGYDVTSIVQLTLSDGSTERRHYHSKYYPVPEVYWVPPGFDLTKLPALPEGATGTEFTSASADEEPGVETPATAGTDDVG